jgi:nucleoside-diphosphate-sugar epimerase
MGTRRVFSSLYGMDCISLRYFNVFGPRQDPGSEYAAVVPLFVTALLEGRSPVIHGDGDQSRDFTYVSNVVDANLLAIEAGGVGGEVFNIACGSASTVNELFGELAAITGASVAATHDDARPGDVRHSYADVSKAVRLLGLEPRVTFDEGLRLTVEWYRSQA